MPSQGDWPEPPTAGRMYDYLLGGSHNFAVDREAAQRAVQAMPSLPGILHEGRAFLRRVVRFLAEAGVDQFLDLGAGIPTLGTVHEVAQATKPEARVVYVDIEPVTVAHSQRLLADNPYAEAMLTDLRRPVEVLDSPVVTDLLDLSRPVAVLLLGVLHFVPDVEEPERIVAAYRAQLAPGSYLAIGHASHDEQPVDDGVAAANAVYGETGTPVIFRSAREISQFFGDFELCEPGVVPVALWHPDRTERPDPTAYRGYGGVARKR